MHAKFFSTLGEVMYNTLAIALLVVGLRAIGVFLAAGEHRVDQPRELVRGGGHGLGLAHPSTQPPDRYSKLGRSK